MSVVTMDRSQSITTDRLVLRHPTIGNAEDVARLMRPDVSQWLASWPPDVDASYAARRIADALDEIGTGRALHWLVALRVGLGVMGWIRVTRSEGDLERGELGFWLGTSFQGLGYATEAVRAVVPVAFHHLGLAVIEAGAQPANVGSLRVLERVGMVPVGQRQVWADARQRFELCEYYEAERRRWSGGAA